MGYEINITDANFTIPAKNLDAAYQEMCALNQHDDLKHGGSSTGAKWFPWMDQNYPETCKNAQDILEQLGFHTETQMDGSLSLVSYDSKVGQEDLFLDVIAPFVANGSYIEWKGEDGDRWRHEIDGGRLIQKTGRIIWE